MKNEIVRIAAMSDLHCTKSSKGTLEPLFLKAAQEADVFVLCGDLTDYGRVDETEILVKELANIRIPVLAVLGNHDFESGIPEVVTQMLQEAGVHVLDGEACEFHGIGFAGSKGFAGGFGKYSLGMWGEPMIKAFVQEALNEALKLESALARLRTQHRVAILHYSPTLQTIINEPEEIFAFLGNSRLEEPLSRYPVDAVFHGHAHNGSHEGFLANRTPVFNVALPLLRQLQPEKPYKIFHIINSDVSVQAQIESVK